MLIALRPAVPEDLPYLYALRQQTMQAHLAASGIFLTKEEHEERIVTSVRK